MELIYTNERGNPPSYETSLLENERDGQKKEKQPNETGKKTNINGINEEGENQRNPLRKYKIPIIVGTSLLVLIPICVVLPILLKKPKHTCPIIKAPAWANMTCSSEFQLGTICSFECQAGYDLKGGPSIKCDSLGKWINPLPVCERHQRTSSPRTCPVINVEADRPEKMNCSNYYSDYDYYSDINYYGMLLIYNRQFGDKCVFTCDIGYDFSMSTNKRLTNTEVKCGEDGTWSGNVLMYRDDGMLVINYGLVQCKLIRCVASNQNADSVSLLPSFGRWNGVCSATYNSTCSYDCESGYELVGNKRNNFLTCQLDKSWLAPLGISPRCEKIRCDPLSDSFNGRYTTCSDANLYKSKCIHRCNEDIYMLIGSRESTCQSDGEWSTNLPTCEKITCDLFHANAINGRRTTCSNANFYNSKCRHSCELDTHELVGSRKSTCQSDGTWSSKAPTCKRKRSRTKDCSQLTATECGDYLNSGSENSVCIFKCMKKVEESFDNTWPYHDPDFIEQSIENFWNK